MPYLTPAGSGYEPVWSATESEYVNQLAFSSDGKHLATACAAGSVAVYRCSDGEFLWREEVHGLGASALAWAHENARWPAGVRTAASLAGLGSTATKNIR
ncbi:hypothetical protein [Candidatus Pantoea soli]|uniref:Anaphase-promoting complex subunit 4-like WD40 domain-containing protein n=1 Tax=Candidatus Pantoea soli TaxID=3098669 RepID=A0A518XJL2_9GAMM|nr:hypothetical protein D8B20_20850 [Pantoea soli]